MATVVEHDKRKQEILEKSLDVFMDEGYEDVTFQKIADRCGITRTTLYIYFKNKREIFLWSIKQLLSALEEKLIAIATDTSISTEQVLKDIMSFILDKCVENKKLFSVLLPYLVQLQKSGINTEERVRRRTIRLQHIMNCAIIRGIRSGEFRKVNIKASYEMLYGLIESAIFKIAVLNQNNVSDIYSAAELAIEGLKIK
jgi:AcrR family transcriptional regulator